MSFLDNYTIIDIDNNSCSSSFDKTRENINNFIDRVINTMKLSCKIGTSMDNLQLRQNISTFIDESTTLSKLINKDLKNLNVMIDKKCEIYGLTNDYKFWLSKFQEITKNLLIKQKNIPLPIIQTISSSHEFSDNNYSMDIFDQKTQELLQVENDREFNEQIIRERHKDIKEIETKISNISEMFKDTNLLVERDGEFIDNIESNIESSKNNTDRSIIEVKNVEKYKRKNRNRSYCFILILFIIVSIIIMVVAIQLTRR